MKPVTMPTPHPNPPNAHLSATSHRLSTSPLQLYVRLKDVERIARINTFVQKRCPLQMCGNLGACIPLE